MSARVARGLYRGPEPGILLLCLESAAARRASMTLRRWLPACGLEHLAPRLIEVRCRPAGVRTWLVLAGSGAVPAAPGAAALLGRTLAELHVRSMGEPRLAEVRSLVSERGTPYDTLAAAADAHAALAALAAAAPPIRPAAAALRGLERRIARFRRDAERLAEALAEHGGGDVLLHGAPRFHAFLVPEGAADGTPSLPDWRTVATGSAAHDASILLESLPPAERSACSAAYRRARAALGRPLPTAPRWRAALDAAARARHAVELAEAVRRAVELELPLAPERRR